MKYAVARFPRANDSVVVRLSLRALITAVQKRLRRGYADFAIHRTKVAAVVRSHLCVVVVKTVVVGNPVDVSTGSVKAVVVLRERIVGVVVAAVVVAAVLDVDGRIRNG